MDQLCPLSLYLLWKEKVALLLKAEERCTLWRGEDNFPLVSSPLNMGGREHRPP